MVLQLFIKEHFPYLLFQLLMTLFLMLLFWLDGFRNADTAVYAIVMTIILTATFLLTRFVLRYSFYQKILQKPVKMEDALQRNGKTPEMVQADRYMIDLYKLYQQEVHSLYSSQNRHLQFMNQWVHQMKTPVSVLELMLQGDELDRKSIQEEVDRMKQQLDIVLVNARLDTFESDMQIEMVPLKEIVTEVISENKRLFITNHVFPSVSIDEGIKVPTDRKWILFAINQLITNAIKYTFEENKKIFLTAEMTEEGVLFSVTDEGIGIPASDLKRVTDAFFTGENGRKTGESTGMGLYLTNEICERLGHDMSISSEVGEGTTVSILFNNPEHIERSGLNGNR
ncbi:sensor histidine kinase [Chungangia koreensis]|uniref:histidine kinase n=1 Tax=Chungangia koreensis TaxID=752657 RepID=A0ABV8X7X6_9LACT